MSEAKIERQGGEAWISSILFGVKIGLEEFRKIENASDSTRIVLDKEMAVIFDKLKEPDKEERMDLVRFKVGDLFSWEEKEVTLARIINHAKRMGVRLCEPEMAFYVAAKMLKGGRIGSFYIPTKINEAFRILYVEKDDRGGISLGLYDKRLVNRNRKSFFEGNEEFLFDK
jgi:hypothetical protein